MIYFMFATGIENSCPVIDGGRTRMDELEKCHHYELWRRDLSLDLNYGHRVNSQMYEYLRDNGMTRDEYHFFQANDLKHRCVLGNDYYSTNEHLVRASGSTEAAGEIFGYAVITRQYYDRYRLPIMHTETNFRQGPAGNEAIRWLRTERANLLRVRNDGLPIVGFTWYSLIDQVDWDTALRENNGRVDPIGLYDLDRKIRPVGEVYRRLIDEWSDVLPTQSVCLGLPVFPPAQHAEPDARARAAGARERERRYKRAPTNDHS